MFSESLVRSHRAVLIRINPEEPWGPVGTIGIEGGALEFLEGVERILC